MTENERKQELDTSRDSEPTEVMDKIRENMADETQPMTQSEGDAGERASRQGDEESAEAAEQVGAERQSEQEAPAHESSWRASSGNVPPTYVSTPPYVYARSQPQVVEERPTGPSAATIVFGLLLALVGLACLSGGIFFSWYDWVGVSVNGE